VNHIAVSTEAVDLRLLAETVRRDTLIRLKVDVYAKLTATPSRPEVIELLNEHLERRPWH
jgi:hypothetical protein